MQSKSFSENDSDALERAVAVNLQAGFSTVNASNQLIKGNADAKNLPSPAIEQFFCARRRSISPMKPADKNVDYHRDGALSGQPQTNELLGRGLQSMPARGCNSVPSDASKLTSSADHFGSYQAKMPMPYQPEGWKSTSSDHCKQDERRNWLPSVHPQAPPSQLWGSDPGSHFGSGRPRGFHSNWNNSTNGNPNSGAQQRDVPPSGFMQDSSRVSSAAGSESQATASMSQLSARANGNSQFPTQSSTRSSGLSGVQINHHAAEERPSVCVKHSQQASYFPAGKRLKTDSWAAGNQGNANWQSCSGQGRNIVQGPAGKDEAQRRDQVAAPRPVATGVFASSDWDDEEDFLYQEDPCGRAQLGHPHQSLPASQASAESNPRMLPSQSSAEGSNKGKLSCPPAFQSSHQNKHASLGPSILNTGRMQPSDGKSALGGQNRVHVPSEKSLAVSAGVTSMPATRPESASNWPPRGPPAAHQPGHKLPAGSACAGQALQQMGGYAVKKTAQPQRPITDAQVCSTYDVASLQGLWQKVRVYHRMADTLPPPTPSYARCPGVFKHSVRQCGCPLVFNVKHVEITASGEEQMLRYFSCTNQECDFRELLPERKMLPMLTCEALDSSTFRIQAAIGAEEVVRHCGGVAWVMRAVGCPFKPISQTTDALNAKRGASKQAECEPPSDTSACSRQLQQPVIEGKAQEPMGSRPPPTQPDCAIFDLAKYDDVVAPLKNQKRLGQRLLSVEGEISKSTQARFRRPSELISDEEVEQLYSKIPEPLRNALMPFQREGVKFGLKHKGRALIADEMGVGKTVQAIALASSYTEEWPLLIIAPASLRLVWAEELERWLPHLRPSFIHVIQGKVDRLGPTSQTTSKIVITSYEMMMRLSCECCRRGGPGMPGAPARCAGPEACMAAGRFKIIIVDESHELRTSNVAPDSLHTEAISFALKRAERAILLSGTPSLSKPFDLFRQIDSLRPGMLGKDRSAFAMRYCNRRLVPVSKGDIVRKKYSNSGLSHAHELHHLLKQEVMLRRLKSEVMSQLPPKRRQVIRLPAPKESERPSLYGDMGGKENSGGSDCEDTQEQLEDVQEEGEEKANGADDRPKWSEGHRTGIAKIPNVVQWLAHAFEQPSTEEEDESSTGNMQNTKKMLLFAHHIDVMDKLASALSGQFSSFSGAKFVRIDGSTDAIDRRAAVHQFRDDASVAVALLSVTAAGTGLDFSKATTVVFAELPAEVAHVRQAEDRAHRKGQHKPVNVYFLVAKGTHDERRWQHLNSSLEKVTAIHDGSLTDSPDGNKGKGLELDALHEVSLTQGWVGKMTQLPPKLTLGQGIDPTAGSVCHEDSLILDTIAEVEDQEPSLPDEQAANHSEGGNSLAEDGKEVENSGPIAADIISNGLKPMMDNRCEEATHTSLEPCEPAVQSASSSAHEAKEDLLGIAKPEQVDEDSDPISSEEDVADGDSSELLCAKMDRNLDRRKRRRAKATRRKERLNDALLRNSESKAIELATKRALALANKPQVWFEVSTHTGRVHFHQSADGSKPLGLSLPIEMLNMGETSSVVSNLLQAIDARKPGGSHVGPAGVLAVPPDVSRSTVEAMIEEAVEFAWQWKELQAVLRRRLIGHCLRTPIQGAADQVMEEAAQSGAFGSSTERYLTSARPDLKLPPGGEWLPVKVKYLRRRTLTEYKQPFLGEQRLCILCASPVSWCSLGKKAVLDGAGALFCSPTCEKKFSMRNNNSMIRRELYEMERGVCQICKLDCAGLVKALRAIEKHGTRWEFLRKQKLYELAPKWGATRSKGHVTRLVKNTLDGNAWQADHIVPVYKGGGLCDIDNFRTLCSVCHQAVTNAQTKERAQMRKKGPNQSSLKDSLTKGAKKDVQGKTSNSSAPKK